MKRNKVLLLGAYGQTNLGDDLLLYNYLKLLTDAGFKEIYINASETTGIPQSILEKFPNIKTFETYGISPFALLKFLKSADCIVYGGGTVYKELYASTGRKPYSLIARLAIFNGVARLLGKKVHNLHIGIGSIKTSFGRFVSRMALRSCTSTTFRDTDSYNYALNVLKLPASKIQHSTDGLFINPEWQHEWNKVSFDKTTAAGKQVIGVNVLSDIPDWVDRQHYLDVMVEFINRLLQDKNHVVLLPFQLGFNANNDLAFMEKEIVPRLARGTSFEIADNLALDTIISSLNQLDVLIGMRFHSLLLATVAETPFVGVSYDTKCTRYLNEIDYPYAIKLEEISVEGLEKQYQAVVASKKDIQNKLHTVSENSFKTGDAWLKNFAL